MNSLISKLRIVDLDRGQDARQLELQGGRALELETRPAAAHLDAERIALDRLRRAVLLAPGLPLAGTPRGNLRLRAPGGVEPEAAPCDRQQHHQAERNEQRPEPAAAGGRGETGLRHLWRSCAGREGDCRNLPGGALSKAPIAAFQSHFHRAPRLIPGGITGLRDAAYSSISQPWIRIPRTLPKISGCSPTAR